jgi:glycoprotein endo-alpha-1,2-mannosidase
MDRTHLRSIDAPTSGRTARWMPLLLCLIGIATTVHIARQAQATAAVGVPRRVLALYYPWYSTPKFSGVWRHQNGVNIEERTIASHTHYPLSGPYDSADPAVIDRHLRQAKAAGIDTLVCSWWGRNDPTDTAIRMLLKQAPKHDMTICIFWEPYRAALTPQDAYNDFAYILHDFGKQPGYLRCGGKPVVFLYSKTAQGLAPMQWAGVVNEVSRRNSPGVMAIADSLSQTYLPTWGASYSLEQIVQMSGQTPEQSAQMLHQAFQSSRPRHQQSNCPTVETIGPGYDDRQYNTHADIGPGVLVDRQNGQRYRSLWEQALQDAPDWILIDSFNEWHNGTEIEPSLESGDWYLQMTRAFAHRFKSAGRVQSNSLSPETPSHSRNPGR